MTFWDFCAPFYDIVERRNAIAYNDMIKTVRDVIPAGASVLEIAAGTGSVTLGIADKVKNVFCTDVSEQMLSVARKKAAKRGVKNVVFGNENIFGINKPDGAFDAVIAGQVLHLLDEPEKAAAELRRVTSGMVILPLAFTKGLKGRAQFMLSIFKLFGFAPKRELSLSEYATFLYGIGFENCEIIPLDGIFPMAVAVWRKKQ
ncbi:MAG: methyltransferase domain-containing protein [Treponema sp.]|jgi:ubiquinone/menaquinone biosynthesis C-methylase UbiE|nr:methyltransferase domain-containing protein [Treponema sp.]